MRIFREEATSALAGFHAGPLSWSNSNLEMLVFVEGGNRRTQNRTWATQVESERFHHCVLLAPLIWEKYMKPQTPWKRYICGW